MTTYGTNSGFVEYSEARGKTIGAWDDEMMSAARLVSSELLDVQFASVFIGRKVTYSQPREWPRLAATTPTIPTYVFSDTEIPWQVEHAVYEMMFRELTSPGLLQKDFIPNKYKSVSVDGAISVNYATFNFASQTQIQIPIIAQLMRNLIDVRSGYNMSPYSGSGVRT